MVDEKLTTHLAELSKLSFAPDELTEMTNDMVGIIALMDKVCGFDPSLKPYTQSSVNYEDLRKDEYKESYPNSEILENAKNTKNDSFVVPKVV